MSKPSKDLLAHIKKEIKIQPPAWSKTIDIDTPEKVEKLVPPEIKKELKPTTRTRSRKAVDFIIPEVEPEPIKAPVPKKREPTPPSSSESEEDDDEEEEEGEEESDEETPVALRGRVEDPLVNFVRNRTMLGMYGLEKTVEPSSTGGFVMQRAAQSAKPVHPPVQGDTCVIQ